MHSCMVGAIFWVGRPSRIGTTIAMALPLYAVRAAPRRVVGAAGIEPARPCGLRILSPMRLPVPPCAPASLVHRRREVSVLPRRWTRAIRALAAFCHLAKPDRSADHSPMDLAQVSPSLWAGLVSALLVLFLVLPGAWRASRGKRLRNFTLWLALLVALVFIYQSFGPFR